MPLFSKRLKTGEAKAESKTEERERICRCVVENNEEPVYEFLKNGGAAEKVRDAERKTLLHLAAFEGHHSMLQLLLRSQRLLPLIDARDRARRTALHLAAAIGDEPCLRTLSAQGASLDLHDEFGCTPLHLAVKFSQPDTTRALLELGADPSLEDMARQNARDMAHQTEDPQIISIMMSFAPRKRSSSGLSVKKLLPSWMFRENRRKKSYAAGSEFDDYESSSHQNSYKNDRLSRIPRPATAVVGGTPKIEEGGVLDTPHAMAQLSPSHSSNAKSPMSGEQYQSLKESLARAADSPSSGANSKLSNQLDVDDAASSASALSKANAESKFGKLPPQLSNENAAIQLSLADEQEIDALAGLTANKKQNLAAGQSTMEVSTSSAAHREVITGLESLLDEAVFATSLDGTYAGNEYDSHADVVKPEASIDGMYADNEYDSHAHVVKRGQHAGKSLQISIDGLEVQEDVVEAAETLLQQSTALNPSSKPTNAVNGKLIQHVSTTVTSPTFGAPAKDFQVGQQVEVDYSNDTEIFGATVKFINGDGTYSVEYEDDDGCMVEVFVTKQQIRPIGLIVETSRVVTPIGTPTISHATPPVTPSGNSVASLPRSPVGSLGAGLQDMFADDAISQGSGSARRPGARPGSRSGSQPGSSSGSRPGSRSTSQVPSANISRTQSRDFTDVNSFSSLPRADSNNKFPLADTTNTTKSESSSSPLAKPGLPPLTSMLAASAMAVQQKDPIPSSDVTPKNSFTFKPGSNTIEASFKFRRRICFDTTVQRLEFQVEWQAPMPVVGSVKPGGEADRRGILSGDSIAFLNDTNSVGKARDELLPKLKERPLALSLDRSTHVDAAHPYVEVPVKFKNVPGDLGMDISWGGSLPVICAVREGSAAWNEGVFIGDAIHSVNNLSATAARKSILTALQQRPLTLTLWRRPLGADITAPWKEYLHQKSSSGGKFATTGSSLASQQAS